MGAAKRGRQLSFRNTTARLRLAIERRRKVRHWGRNYMIAPRLVSEAFGDGKQIIWLAPLNTRPNYYVVRIDSKWNLSNWESDAFYEHLDEVYDAIEDEYGSHDREEGKYIGWPALNLGAGCAWGEEEWPVERAKQ